MCVWDIVLTEIKKNVTKNNKYKVNPTCDGGKMKQMGRRIFSALFIVALCACASRADIDGLKRDFMDPTPEAHAETWYHFTTNAITAEGITADIEAMRDIGYKAAHVFAIGCFGNVPGFDVRIGSEKWRGLMRHLGKEAKRCGLDLGMHNCPGWSSSGGPWIKPEDSMKKLVGTEKYVKGPFSGIIKLETPPVVAGYYRDVAVIAVPSAPPMPKPKVSSDIPGGESIIDGKVCTLPVKNKGGGASFVFEFDRSFGARFAKFVFGDKHVYVDVDISVSDDGKNYEKIRTYRVSSFMDSGVPKYVSLNGRKYSGKFFKFDFRHQEFPDWFLPRDMHIKEISLTENGMLDSVDQKTSMGKTFAYHPPADASAPLAGVPLSRTIVLSGEISPDGSLKANLPEGDWNVLRIGYTSTGAMNAPTNCMGLECDKLSKRGLDAHWPHYMAKMQEDFGGALKNATIDSYEMGGQNWTQDFPGEFKKRRGYDIVKWLPAMLGYMMEDDVKTSKFLFDVQTTVAELFAENYFDYFAQLCAKNGLTSIVEPYGGPFDYVRCARNADFPATEFWIMQAPPTRAVSSIVNVYGKRRAGAEAFTTMYDEGRWQQDPRQLKIYGDRAWARGVSALVMHTYVHQPFNAGPGFSLAKHGSQLNRLNTWWRMGGDWVKYISRAQTLLQRGSIPAEVLILPPQHIPNKLFYDRNSYGELRKGGFDFDIASNFDLGELLCVEGGKVRASKGGAAYSLLVLDDVQYMSVSKLKALEKLLNDGASVAAKRPKSTISLSDDPGEFNEIVDRIWGRNGEKSRKVGKGVLYASEKPLEILRKMGLKPRYIAPNFEVIARRDGSTDIFYLLPMAEKISGNVSFLADVGKVPQIWDPIDGSIENAAVWKREGDYVKVWLDFEHNNPKFVVFSEGSAAGVSKFDAPSISRTDRGIKILEAVYGIPKFGLTRNVKEIVEKSAQKGEGVTVSNSFLGGDPAPMKPKRLYVKYSIDGNVGEKALSEGEVFLLPYGKDVAAFPVYSNGVLSVRFDENAEVGGELNDGTAFKLSVSDLPKPCDISAGWNVKFQKNRGAPDSIKLDKLRSLSESEIDGVKYFSGEMTYSKEVDLPGGFFGKNRRIMLCFEDIYNVAEVYVNGAKVRTLWAPPFECDITSYVKRGANSIEIKVANLWVNRIIGDQAFPPEGYPKWVLENGSVSKTKRFTSSHWHDSWPKGSPLKKSGLVGKAEVRAFDIIPVK